MVILRFSVDNDQGAPAAAAAVRRGVTPSASRSRPYS